MFCPRHYVNRNQDYCVEMERKNMETAKISKELKRLSKEIYRFVERGELNLGCSYSDILAKSAGCNFSSNILNFDFLKWSLMGRTQWVLFVKTIYQITLVNFCSI